MSKVKPKLISFEDAALVCGGLHPNTFRQRKAGTENLTHVPMGRRVMLIESEFEAWLDARIAQAQASERKRRKALEPKKGLRLVSEAV